MNVEAELARQRIEDEKTSNTYVLKTVRVVLLIDFIFQILNELGFFYIDKVLFRTTFFITFIFTVSLFILSKLPKYISPGHLKYVILINVIFVTLVNTSILSFHASLMIFFPLIVSTHYHSSKISAIGIIGACICAFVSPLISLKFNTFDVSFLVYLLKIINPESLTQSSKIDEILKTTNYNSLTGIIFFYSFPHLMFTIGYGVIAYTVNRSKYDSQKARVTEMKIVQDNILYSVADLIENRDSNTGTHVKRTSEVVRILVNELKQTDKKHSTYFWNSVIKSAPMHDLGKIAIPDSILQKPSKLSPEEFEIIKNHSQKSADIIEQMLRKIESKEFLTIAENIARYHHERYDGSGYPCKLKGTDIPYEARIMAIADVFDALVSKRCYKQAKTPEEAYAIIKDSMGSHFDPELMPTFDSCFEQLKEYYLSEQSSNE